ncbi:MAG TPA: bifunctional diguanylate cyclase/phosphodiesterase, partial [Rhodoferax sp.]|nr:bifunctional diguanylate cyclase/phosphodiesterase [Rhodoferax sp.]
NNSPEDFSCDVRLNRGLAECWVNLRAYRLTAANQHVLCVIDISPWKTNDAVYRHAAEHDELTGLANRSYFKKMVEAQLRSDQPFFSIALLDLDGFKKVNDTYGHAMGDAVLIETSKRLTRIAAPGDVLARLGGDEFVLLLNGQDAETAHTAVKKALLAIARPFDTAPHNAYLGVSIGIAQYPDHGSDYSTLLKNADTAMYHSKNAGKNRVSVFAASDDSVDFSLKAAIHNGIQEGEFFLEYQPQYDVQRRLVGAEALMRWTSRDFGRVGPDKFIPIVEEAGLMPFLGKWALRYACHQLKKFHQQMPGFVMSVNVSPVQFGADGFDTQVIDAITETGVDPATVILEITESTLMRSQEKTERALALLRERGIRFSIDDFGTGFSSLAYLTRLPVSSIKIDKAFVRAIEAQRIASATDSKLITAMINLAHSIDLKVVAEGVENEAQFSFLKQSGCDLIQGYLLGKPMTSDAISRLLEQRVGTPA